MIDQKNYSVQDIAFMREALRLAEQGAQKNEVPVGAVVVFQGEIIGEGYNCPVSQCDPCAHAEIQALRAAGKYVNNYRLVDCDLYVTVEPCTMCTGAIVHSRIRRLFYGAPEPKAGVAYSRSEMFAAPYFNHKVEVTGGVLEAECRERVQHFFKRRRQEKQKNNQ